MVFIYQIDQQSECNHNQVGILDNFTDDNVKGLSVPFACVGSGDPVRVLCLYTTNTLDTL